jgi:hypothetical protein
LAVSDKTEGEKDSTKSSILCANADNEHVERNLCCRSIALDLRFIVDTHDLLLVIDLGGFSFVKLDRGLLVTQEVPDRLHDGAVLDCSSRT